MKILAYKRSNQNRTNTYQNFIFGKQSYFKYYSKMSKKFKTSDLNFK